MADIYGAQPAGITGDFYGGHPMGVLAEAVPSSGLSGPGYLFAGLTFPADTGKRVRGVITRWPTLGTFAPNVDSSFDYSGATDYALYRLYTDGVASTADIGFGPGIGKLDLQIGVDGGALSGGVTLDGATASGALAGNNPSALGGNVDLAFVSPGGVVGGFSPLSAPVGAHRRAQLATRRARLSTRTR